MPTEAPPRRLLPSTAGEFVSIGGKWFPAKTPKKYFTVDVIDAETGEQEMVEHIVLDPVTGQPVYEDNPVAVRTIQQMHPEHGYIPTMKLPEATSESTRITDLERTIADIHNLVLGTAKPVGPLVAPDGAALRADAQVVLNGAVPVPDGGPEPRPVAPPDKVDGRTKEGRSLRASLTSVVEAVKSGIKVKL